MPYRRKNFQRPELKCDHGRTAFVNWNRERFWLGAWNGKSTPSAEVMQKYLRTCQLLEHRWEAEQANVPQPEDAGEILIAEGILSYLQHLENDEDGARRPDGSLRTGFARARYQLRPLHALFGDEFARDFTAAKLKLLRKATRAGSWWSAPGPEVKKTSKNSALFRPAKGWSITTANSATREVCRLFAWLESEGLVPQNLTMHLETVKPLAGDQEETQPAPDWAVQVVLQFVSPTVATMIQLQRLTAMRAGEVCAMTLDQIDRSRVPWVYRPVHHKNQWRKHLREIPLGPEARELLKPFISRPAGDWLFDPQESQEWHRERQTTRQRAVRSLPDRVSRRFSKYTYGQAIAHGIAAARKAKHDVPDWTSHQLLHARITEVEYELGWDAAQAVGGHESMQATKRYAHRRHQRALKIAEGTQRPRRRRKHESG